MKVSLTAATSIRLYKVHSETQTLNLWLLVLLDMRLKAIEFVLQKVSRTTKFQDVDLAKELKKLFDDTFFPTWQCIVGKNFGSDISFEEKHMLYFHFNSTAILLWRAG